MAERCIVDISLLVQIPKECLDVFSIVSSFSLFFFIFLFHFPFFVVASHVLLGCDRSGERVVDMLVSDLVVEASALRTFWRIRCII